MKQRQPITSQFLGQALRNAGESNFTEWKQKQGEEEFVTTTETYSLISELSLKRVRQPVRGERCTHFNRCMELGEYVEEVRSSLQQKCYIC